MFSDVKLVGFFTWRKNISRLFCELCNFCVIFFIFYFFPFLMCNSKVFNEKENENYRQNSSKHLPTGETL